jgi:proteasome lid subunit RPN8/RPN11
MDPEEIYRVWKNAEKDGKEIIGIYRSHPSFYLSPSALDRENMKEGKWIWIIVKGRN